MRISARCLVTGLAWIFLAAPSMAREAPTDPASVLKLVRPVRIENDVKELVAFPTRHTLAPANVDAGRWVEDQFKAIGYEAVRREPFSIRNVERWNVICEKPGTVQPARWILIGGHYDSRMEHLGDVESPAPGADDNASGVAAILELARVLQPIETELSIRFVAFSGEEQGLVGARAMANQLGDDRDRIEVMINLDMVGHPIDAERRQIVVEHDPGLRVRENDADSRAWADRLLRAARQTELRPIEGSIYGSDYIPFEAAGVPCVGLFDGADREPFYHTGEDRLDGVNAEYTADVVRLVLGALLEKTTDESE